MTRARLDKNVVVEKAAQLANQIGLENVQLKTLAESLNIQSPSLYNHIKGIDDLHHELMLYGWWKMEEKMLEVSAEVGDNGYAAWEAICRAFYSYATKNPGVFSAMLWYNKYHDKETQKVTQRLFSTCFQIASALGISEDNCNHLIRTFRAFLEGYSLLVNNGAFGHELPVEDSFNLSLQVLLAGMKELEGK